MNTHDKLKFNKNWNNKLNCNCFTTIRIANKTKFKKGNILEIIITDRKGNIKEHKGFARIAKVITFTLHQISDGMSLLDTNLPREEFIKMFQTMYKNYNFDFTTKKLMFVILQYTKE